MEFIKKDTFTDEDSFNFSLTTSEYNYICDLLHYFYNGLKKLPKNMRTPKFYLLENIIDTKFKYSIKK